MRHALKIVNWILCRSIVVLIICILSMSVVFAGSYGSSKDANTVQGKAPGVVNGLATLDGAGNVVQAVVSAATSSSLTMQGEVSSENASIVPLPVGTPTIISTLAFGSTNSGDRIYIIGQFLGTKGTVTGGDSIWIQKDSGTSNIKYLNNANNNGLFNNTYTPASGQVLANTSGVIKVTSTGTLTMRLIGLSSGSTTTISASYGQMHGFFLKH